MRRLFLIMVFFIMSNFMSIGNSFDQVHTNSFNEKYRIEKLVNCTIVGQEITETAKNYIGHQYKWGATGPYKFDCSGFMKYIFNSHGIDLSRTSRTQYHEGPHPDRTRLLPGDLIFWSRRKTPNSIYHVGMVIEPSDENGNFRFIHSSRGGVQISHISKHERNFYGATRVLL